MKNVSPETSPVLFLCLADSEILNWNFPHRCLFPFYVKLWDCETIYFVFGILTKFTTTTFANRNKHLFHD